MRRVNVKTCARLTDAILKAVIETQATPVEVLQALSITKEAIEKRLALGVRFDAKPEVGV